MALSASDLAAVRTVMREEIDAALATLGLANDSQHEITERRADMHYLRLARKSQERLNDTLKRTSWLAGIALILGAVKMGFLQWLGHLFASAPPSK